MQEKIAALKTHVREASANPGFIHHLWFVQWHLEIVERLSLELLEHYPKADRELLEVMVWLHDYGKILDFDHQYEMTLPEARKKLQELQFPGTFVDTAVSYIAMHDNYRNMDLHTAPIEVQISSSADACSHFIGPFMALWWYENAYKPFEQLMADNRHKADKDWNLKVVLPEARKAFEGRYRLLCEQSGELPRTFL